MSRRLGQHFLHDPAILDRIVAVLAPDPADVVVEIGPGRGTLTRRLAARVRYVVALERDAELAASPCPPNVTVVQGDALDVDWHEAVAGAVPSGSETSLKIVGNIPYYITTPLIAKALSPPPPAVVVFLVQREVADRLAAPPGSKTYGALSVGVQASAAVKVMFTVRRGAFQPPPKVDSAVVRLTPLAQPLVEPVATEAFRKFVTRLFSQRRKQIGRSLRNLWPDVGPAVDRIAVEAGIDPASRPEAASPQALVKLFKLVER